jgi:TolA-binding protein
MADATMEYNLQQLKEQMERHEMTLTQIQQTAQQNLQQMQDLKRQLDLIAQAEGIDLRKGVQQEPVTVEEAGLKDSVPPSGPANAPWQSPQAGQAGARGMSEPPHPQPLGSTRREDNTPPVVEKEEDKAALKAPDTAPSARGRSQPAPKPPDKKD